MFNVVKAKRVCVFEAALLVTKQTQQSTCKTKTSELIYMRAG